MIEIYISIVFFVEIFKEILKIEVVVGSNWPLPQR